MKRGKKFKFIIPVAIIASSLGLFSQDRATDLLIVQDLVDFVSEKEISSSPENISKKTSKKKTTKEDKKKIPTETDALTYITKAFSEHSYNDCGGWASEFPSGGNTSKNYCQSRTSNYRVPDNYQFSTYNLWDFQMPVKGSYTSYYGYRPKFGRFHYGIDIALNTGDTVRSALPGVVVRIKNDPDGYGNYVVISHDGQLETLYAHLTRELVVTGQRLKAGDAVGLGGATGNASGPHLHFETRLNGDAINPLNYLPGSFVRK